MASPITLRLSEQARRQVAQLARRKGTTSSQVIREAIEAFVCAEQPSIPAYESMADLIGVVRGSNPGRSSDAGRQLTMLLKTRRRASARKRRDPG